MAERPDVHEALIGVAGDLPALPAVVAEVLRVTEDPMSSTSDVSRIVQSDPAMTAKVLRVSNSSYYGMKQYVGTLKLALVILGVRQVRNIVLGISVFETLNGHSDDVRIAQDIWNRSLHTAGICKKLCEALGLAFQGEEFIAGLLSDIGIMGLLRKDPGNYRSTYESLGDNLELLRQAEQAQFKFTHAQVAEAMAAQWNLPQTLTDALGMQYPREGQSLANARDPKLAAVLRIARALNSRQEGGIEAALEEEEAWAALDGARNPVTREERPGLLASVQDEVNALPALSL